MKLPAPLEYLRPFAAIGDKDTVHRLGRYEDWMNDAGRAWWQVDLASYRDFLLRVGGNDGNGLAPVSVVAHLSTIRARYALLLRNPIYKAAMYDLAQKRLGPDARPADLKAYVDELRQGIQDAIHPDAASVSVITDRDPVGLRLSLDEARDLLRSMTSTRDYAAVALALATGIREAELCALVVDDLYSQMNDGALALFVRKGKGAISRKVPYGQMVTVLDAVRAWMDEAGITSGRVFPFTPRTFQRILAAHPIERHGELVPVRPHDLRRSYARQLYDAGVPLLAIKQNLGHSDLDTTLRYIGDLEAHHRQPPAVFDFSDGLFSP